MMTPRCGETDDGNMSPNYALYNGKPKWDKNYLIYTFDSSVKPEVLEKLGPAVQQGFEEWIKHTQFTFAEGRPSSTFDIVIDIIGVGMEMTNHLMDLVRIFCSCFSTNYGKNAL